MLASFLIFVQIFTFLVAEYLVSILHIFRPIYRLVIPTFLKVLSINKIDSLNFSLVLERTV